ncbi:hypothetical protein P167DRAFT_542519 [Morchella conica CCBAS932]|uniref:RING-type domain-containing protein n=1 Tax=Morchella conica CCBAS932 TaxID=1392247 RepID=A0A3N4KZ26_9PEZI|nr:hypothetical protein P167DRAFT_542519 [Morchella conica CCBAS932]
MSNYDAEIEAILAATRARIEAEEEEIYEIVELSDDPMPDAPNTVAVPGMAEFYGYGRRLEDIGEEQQQEEEEEEYVNRYATNEDIARELGIPGFGEPHTDPLPAQGLFFIHAPTVRPPRTPPPLTPFAAIDPPEYVPPPHRRTRAPLPPPPTPLSESESEPEDAAVPEHMQCGICLCRQITLAYSGCTHGACRTCVKRICATQGPLSSTFPCHVCRALVGEVGPLVEREGAVGLRWGGWEVERWVLVVEWVMGVSARVRGRWGRWL